MNSTILTADLFVSGVYEYQDEAFSMQALLSSGDELVGGTSVNPALPNVLSLDMAPPLNQLQMMTNNLQELAAPAELCILKAMELISSRQNYQLSLQTFRMELLTQTVPLDGVMEVSALVAGIKCVADYILASFDKVAKSHVDLFPYEFYALQHGRYLFMTKIAFDANLPDLPIHSPAAIAKPAYAYSSVQTGARAPYIAPSDHGFVF